MSRKNLKRYYQAWELRQQGKKLREIAQIMGFKSRENARRMVAYIDFLIEEKPYRMSEKLRKLARKYRLNPETKYTKKQAYAS
jgi:hypothetical protein